MKRKHRHLTEVAFVGGLILLALAFRFWSPITFSLVLAVPSLEPSLAGLGREAARQEVTLPANGKTIRADLYRPANPGSAILLVHGLSPAGRRHPDLMRLARLLSRHGVLVLVPELEGFAAFRLSGGEVEEISSALHYLDRLHGRVGIAGFSFGAGPALLAAADHPNLRLVGSFGGYADLRHVITYITTGVHEFGGARYTQRQEEYNRWKLLAMLAGFVESQRDQALLQTLTQQKLANPSEDTSSLETALGEEGGRVLALILNRQEEAVNQLLARLPAGALEAVDRLSPLPVVSRLPGRLLIAHGAGDDSIPFTESLRLAERAGGRARVFILHTFHHTGPQRFWSSLGQRAADGWKLVRLADELLTAE